MDMKGFVHDFNYILMFSKLCSNVKGCFLCGKARNYILIFINLNIFLELVLLYWSPLNLRGFFNLFF